MTTLLARLGRILFTLVFVALAGFVGWNLWDYYMLAPWTRDGRVSAEVVGVAPDVSGIVTEVLVRDNQTVQRGQPLFRIDRDRFALALQQAEAVVAGRQAAHDRAQRDLVRYRALDQTAVSVQRQEQAISDAAVAAAALQQAVADREVARLNLQRSEVVASVNGTISNLALRPGDYVPAGRAVLALVDADSFHVSGYFEETKLPRIHPGAPATIRLMGETALIRGHVESIAGGIVDRERGEGTNLLANVNPTFNWVRLAQRIPVRIALDEVPPGIRLVAGRTATVTVTDAAPAGAAPHGAAPGTAPGTVPGAVPGTSQHPPAANRQGAAATPTQGMAGAAAQQGANGPGRRAHR
ncbi:HlyD family secretion protein [Roseomonas sp. NAR14]|uniref:HlyD family secretion protein n=1 Tax=Roseomonas acroporae TaxID=2937791 RepID=A0A9X1Y481_9PROT|nr:HlyD family secretion protein [Roseomonas acroporae]MCK8783123.1 HlyD family secretion protein [Roseomonas acroporae]